MNLDELAQVGLNAPEPDDLRDSTQPRIARYWFERGKKAATDHIIAAILRDGAPLGATGSFPQGVLEADDQGELRMAVAYDRRAGIVRVEFGKPVAWLGLPPNEAVALAETLIKHARQSPHYRQPDKAP